MNPHFRTLEQTSEFFRDKSVAVVGSGPSCLHNEGDFIDKHDIVVRINNYKMRTYEHLVGSRTDVFYSFFGGSIKKPQQELKEDGVRFVMCKCPDAKFMESEWHRTHNKEKGVDFRTIYQDRKQFWFCPTYIPTTEAFLAYFNLLGRHVPTTGFSCLLDVISFPVKRLYITGFDFFSSRIHNVNESWNGYGKNHDDPIKHMPELECKYLARLQDPRITFDHTMTVLMNESLRVSA